MNILYLFHYLLFYLFIHLFMCFIYSCFFMCQHLKISASCNRMFYDGGMQICSCGIGPGTPLPHQWSLLQAWWDPSLAAETQRSFPGPDPFKRGQPSPFRQLPSCDPSCILVDSAHSFHIKGFGVDWCASCIVLGCLKGFFGNTSLALDARLEAAYREFQAWCVQERRVTSCDMWSKLKFDMVRNTDFPASIGGKGFDTAVCSAWLEFFFQDKAGLFKTWLVCSKDGCAQGPKKPTNSDTYHFT